MKKVVKTVVQKTLTVISAMNGLYLYSAFLTSGRSECFTIFAPHPPIHAHIHTPMAESATQGDSQLVRSSQGEALCSGTPRGAGDQTCNLPVANQPDLPPEPHAAPY